MSSQENRILPPYWPDPTFVSPACILDQPPPKRDQSTGGLLPKSMRTVVNGTLLSNLRVAGLTSGRQLRDGADHRQLAGHIIDADVFLPLV